MHRETGPSASSLEKLRSAAAWREVEQDFFATGDASRVQRALTDAVDGLIRETHRTSIEPILTQGAALLAIGGYGRGEVFPYAAVDLLVLLEGEASWAALREPLSELVGLLWEAGVRLNHTARTVSECLEFREQALELSLNLMDARFLAGDPALHQRLESKWPSFLEKSSHRLSQHLVRLTRSRHANYQNTVHQHEPDVQDAPGGLRDLAVINLLNRLSSRSVSDGHLAEPAEFLSAVRCFLHYSSRSDRNLLTTAAQESIRAQPFTGVQAVREWMRQYFENARLVFREARRAMDDCERSESSLVGNLRDWRARLSTSEFTVSRDRLFLRSPAELESDPAVIFRLLEFMGRHGIPPAVETEQHLAAARPAFAAYLSQPRPLWGTLESLLELPHAPVAFRALQNARLLAELFPEWALIADLVPLEAEHRYTIDEHTLKALERVAELRTTADPARKRFSELLSEIDKPALLAFALLFHDFGKGAGDAAELSASLARQALARIRAPEEDLCAVEFLTARQLVLAEVMAARDMDDPATARQLAERVGTIERLKQLAVLTYADIAAMSPDAMTPWRLEQLWRAYEVAQHELTRELETDRIQEVPYSVPGRPAFLKGFPVRYLRAHSPAEIEAHVRLFEESRPTGFAVQLERIEGAYKLTIIGRDMPSLFASLAGAISGFGLDILKAEAFSNAKGIVLDTFVFADPQRTLELNAPEVQRLLDLIRRVALGKTDDQRSPRSRSQTDWKKRTVPPQVHFDSDACDTATLVEITAEDRPGLLYNLATVFSATACNIDVVLIDTKGQRAIDVFYVAHDGQKLTPELQAMLKEKLLAVC
ncbi:MAG TPA: hypothetical protein VMH80_09410 [Bryobacteraceae bacterium]|nr:hypothetical protein [Bryobacteraceae bacterium]